MIVRAARDVLVLTLVAAVLAVAPSLLPAQSKPGRTLEQQLLEDLEAKPLDADLPRELQQPPAKPAEQSRPSGADDAAQRQRVEELSKQLERELGAAAVSEDQNPLLDLVRQMQQVQGLIEQTKTGGPTQQLQSSIVASLDELLKAARKKAQECSAAQASPKSTAPRRSPSPSSKPKPATPGKGGKSPATKPGPSAKKPASAAPDRDQYRDVIKNIWGSLPQRPSEEMLELPSEEFLPKYELLIEAYYKRLAEEQGGGQ